MSAPIPFEVIADLLGLGVASGARAALSLFIVACLARAGWVELPQQLSFASSTPMLGALLAGAIVEEWLERDDDAQHLLHMLKYGVHGTGGVVASWLLIEQFGLPLDGWPVAAIGGALAIATHDLRMRVHHALRGLEAGIVSPRQWVAWLEAGGVVGVAVSVVLAPILAVVFVGAAAAGALGLWALLRSLERAMRRPCDACGHLARKEARRCPACAAELPVVRWVGDGLLDFLERTAEPVRRAVGRPSS